MDEIKYRINKVDIAKFISSNTEKSFESCMEEVKNDEINSKLISEDLSDIEIKKIMLVDDYITDDCTEYPIKFKEIKNMYDNVDIDDEEIKKYINYKDNYIWIKDIPYKKIVYNNKYSPFKSEFDDYTKDNEKINGEDILQVEFILRNYFDYNCRSRMHVEDYISQCLGYTDNKLGEHVLSYILKENEDIYFSKNRLIIDDNKSNSQNFLSKVRKFFN